MSNKRITLCSGCAFIGTSVPAKYRCPACTAPSCSLACVKKHKEETNCTGVRDRAAPVPISKYNENNFISDFTLLEDTSRVLDSAKRALRNPIPHISGYRNPLLAPGVSRGRMNMLVKEAAKRNINLRFMPRGLSRHSRNTSFVRTHVNNSLTESPTNWKGKVMFWHMDIYFESCNLRFPGQKLVKVDECNEDDRLTDILNGAVQELGKDKKRRRSGVITCTMKKNDGYRKYLDVPQDDMVVYLQNEHVDITPQGPPSPSSTPISANAITRPEECDICRYIRVDTNQSVREMLNGRSILEFPVLHVAMKGSQQATDLAEATRGMFEKPDESDESESSESENESENDDGRDEGGKRPDSPVHGAPVLTPEGPLAERQSDESREFSTDDEGPPRKKKRVGPSSSTPSVLPGDRKGDRKRAEIERETDVTATLGSKSQGDDKRDGAREKSKPGNDRAVYGIALRSVPANSTKNKVSANDNRSASASAFYSRKVNPPKQFKKDLLETIADEQDIGSPATDSLGTDTSERRSIGLPFESSFMADGFKAILMSTKIPRKRKTEGVLANGSSAKQSRV
eukprot:GFKZ01006068.1.p1 GENE.GFKZ01006068.1~~GFKZ01006068.1.p1  ORF type:complete len:571 (-),score=92.46 GFKZ01006068.1:582-2294(-)